MSAQKQVGRRAAVKAVGALGVAGAGAAMLRAPESVTAAPAAIPGHEIVGTWLISSPGPSTALLQMYTVEGGLVVTDVQHPQRSTQLGVWERIGERTFLMRHISFRFDPEGVFNGTIDVRARYVVNPDGDTMAGTGLRLELDLNGNLLVPPIAWEATAVRIRPLPLA